MKWNSPEKLPEVQLWSEKQFWIAVKFQPSGRVLTYSAYYLNRPLIEGEELENRIENQDIFCSESGEPIHMVGWANWGKHYDYDDFYEMINFHESCELVGWAEYTPPVFTGIGPGSNTQVVLGQISKEREHQINMGYDIANDDEYEPRILTYAACAYALFNPDDLEEPGVIEVPKIYPWEEKTFSPSFSSFRENLIKAAALIVAEIEKTDRDDDFFRTEFTRQLMEDQDEAQF